jgi:hypothetical protein
LSTPPCETTSFSGSRLPSDLSSDLTSARHSTHSALFGGGSQATIALDLGNSATSAQVSVAIDGTHRGRA